MKDNLVKISVILPIYNSQNYLKEAIESILSQTYKDFELILINDGSTDNSENIIHSFQDERIVYIKNPKNLGLIKSLNIGLGQAKGEYIARMDADDVSLPTRFEFQLKAFEQNKNAVLVSSDYYSLTGNDIKYIKNDGSSDYFKGILLFSTCFAHPTVMMRNIFKEKGLSYDENYLHTEDYKLWVDLVTHGEFCNVNKALLKYRTHSGQISAQNKQTQQQNSEAIRKLYLKSKGFTFSDEDILIHNTIGNNVFITSLELLSSIEKWLLELLRQNENLMAFNKTEFEKAIHKFWFDSCGFTNLGMEAYKLYSNSEISKKCPVSFADNMLLFGKCFVRKFRK